MLPHPARQLRRCLVRATLRCEQRGAAVASLQSVLEPSQDYEQYVATMLLRKAYDNRFIEPLGDAGAAKTKVEVANRYRHLGVGEHTEVKKAFRDHIARKKKNAESKILSLGIKRFGKQALMQAQAEMTNRDQAFYDRVKELILREVAFKLPNMLQEEYRQRRAKLEAEGDARGDARDDDDLATPNDGGGASIGFKE